MHENTFPAALHRSPWRILHQVPITHLGAHVARIMVERTDLHICALKVRLIFISPGSIGTAEPQNNNERTLDTKVVAVVMAGQPEGW